MDTVPSQTVAPASACTAHWFTPGQEKCLLSVIAALFSMGGYFWVGQLVDPARAVELRTVLDDRIPLWPVLMWAYGSVYTVTFIPAFTIRSRSLFRRVAGAFLAASAVAFVSFILFPVTAEHLRPPIGHLDPASFQNWALKVNYTLDTPFNLFPSLHLTAATVVALAAWKTRPVYGLLALIPVAGIAVSIVTVKQHFIVDGIAGLLLGWLTHRLIVDPWRPEAGEPVAYGWRGPLAYGVFTCLAYLFAYTVFRSGWHPWP